MVNLAGVVNRNYKDVTLIRRTETIVNFRPSYTNHPVVIKAIIQPADKSKLNKDAMDWSLRYLRCHSTSTLAMGDLLDVGAIRYKCFEVVDYDGYGYWEGTFEEVTDGRPR